MSETFDGVEALDLLRVANDRALEGYPDEAEAMRAQVVVDAQWLACSFRRPRGAGLRTYFGFTDEWYRRLASTEWQKRTAPSRYEQIMSLSSATFEAATSLTVGSFVSLDDRGRATLAGHGSRPIGVAMSRPDSSGMVTVRLGDGPA